MRWRRETGVPWRIVPPGTAPWRTLYRRSRRWQQAGVWDRILAAVQADADARGALDWDLHVVDGSVVRAHQHAAGATGGPRRAGRSAGAEADSAPSFMSGQRAAASRSGSC